MLVRLPLLTFLLLSQGVLPGQAPLVELSLAEDSEQRGPAAWTYVRASILPRLPGWPEDQPAFAAIKLSVYRDGRIESRPGTSSDAYLAARVQLPSGTIISASCDHAGLEKWQLHPSGYLEARLEQLLKVFDLRHERNLLSLDVGAVTGNLMAGSVSGDPLHSLLTEGAVECGVLRLAVFHEDDRWLISGKSQGGLLLPSVLALLADLQRYPAADGKIFGPRPMADIDRWLLLAAAGRGSIREEAARQLARFDSPRATRGLEQLLHSEGASRNVAIASLIRRGEEGSLTKILASGESGDEEAAALADYARSILSEQAKASPVSTPTTLAWARPSLWLLLVLSSLAIAAKMISSRRS